VFTPSALKSRKDATVFTMRGARAPARRGSAGADLIIDPRLLRGAVGLSAGWSARARRYAVAGSSSIADTGAARRGAWRLIPQMLAAGGNVPHQERLVEARNPRTPWSWSVAGRQESRSCCRCTERPRALGRAQDLLSPVRSSADGGSEGAGLRGAPRRNQERLISLSRPSAASLRSGGSEEKKP
jgi:hypothetical protein